MQELREDIELDLEVYKIDALDKSPRRFEGHNLWSLTVSSRRRRGWFPRAPSWFALPSRWGPGGYLLEPRSEDGLAAWNFFDAELKPGGDFPVMRLTKTAPISLTGAEPLRRKRGAAAADHLRHAGWRRWRPHAAASVADRAGSMASTGWPSRKVGS